MRWCCFPDLVASSFPPSLFEASHAQSVFAHCYQLSYQQPNHSIKETAGLDLHVDQIA